MAARSSQDLACCWRAIGERASEFDLSLALTLHREERIADNTVELGFEHTFIHVLHGGKGLR